MDRTGERKTRALFYIVGVMAAGMAVVGGIYLFAGNIPGIIIGDLTSRTVALYQYPAKIFSRSVAVSDRSFIIRGFDTAALEQVFLKVDPASKLVLQRENDLTEKRSDAGFS